MHQHLSHDNNNGKVNSLTLSDGAVGLSTIPDFCLAFRSVSMLVVLAMEGLPPTPVAIGLTMADEAVEPGARMNKIIDKHASNWRKPNSSHSITLYYLSHFTRAGALVPILVIRGYPCLRGCEFRSQLPDTWCITFSHQFGIKLCSPISFRVCIFDN